MWMILYKCFKNWSQMGVWSRRLWNGCKKDYFEAPQPKLFMNLRMMKVIAPLQMIWKIFDHPNQQIPQHCRFYLKKKTNHTLLLKKYTMTFTIILTKKWSPSKKVFNFTFWLLSNQNYSEVIVKKNGCSIKN